MDAAPDGLNSIFHQLDKHVVGHGITKEGSDILERHPGFGKVGNHADGGPQVIEVVRNLRARAGQHSLLWVRKLRNKLRTGRKGGCGTKGRRRNTIGSLLLSRVHSQSSYGSGAYGDIVSSTQKKKTCGRHGRSRRSAADDESQFLELSQ